MNVSVQTKVKSLLDDVSSLAQFYNEMKAESKAASEKSRTEWMESHHEASALVYGFTALRLERIAKALSEIQEGLENAPVQGTPEPNQNHRHPNGITDVVGVQQGGAK